MAVDTFFNDVDLLLIDGQLTNSVSGSRWVVTAIEATDGGDHIALTAAGEIGFFLPGPWFKVFNDSPTVQRTEYGGAHEFVVEINPGWPVGALIYSDLYVAIKISGLGALTIIVSPTYNGGPAQEVTAFVPTSGKLYFHLLVDYPGAYTTSSAGPGGVTILGETGAAQTFNLQRCGDYSYKMGGNAAIGYPAIAGPDVATASTAILQRGWGSLNVAQQMGIYVVDETSIISGSFTLTLTTPVDGKTVTSTINAAGLAPTEAVSALLLQAANEGAAIGMSGFSLNVQIGNGYSVDMGGNVLNKTFIISRPLLSATDAGFTLDISGSYTHYLPGISSAVTKTLPSSQMVSWKDPGQYGISPPQSAKSALYINLGGASTEFAAVEVFVTDQFGAEQSWGLVSLRDMSTVATSLSGRLGGSGVTTSSPAAGVYIFTMDDRLGTRYFSRGVVYDTSTIPSGVSKIYAVRGTGNKLRLPAPAFPTLPWPTTSIPDAGGGDAGGGASSALYYFPFESGDTSPIANRGSVTASLQLGANATVAPDGGGGFVLGDGAWTPAASYVSDQSHPITGACTLECWVNFQSMATGDLVGGEHLVFFVGGGEVWLYEFGASIEGVSPGISGWHHLAVVRDGGASSARRVYLDGALVPSGTTASGTASWMSTGVRIGQYCGYTNQNADALYDDLIVTEAAKYTANFTPAARGSAGGTTPTPTSDITAAGYNTLGDFTGTGTFNQQATFPPAYFSSNATIDPVTATGDTYTVDNDGVNFTSSKVLSAFTSSGTFVRGTPQNFSGDVTLDDFTEAAAFYCDIPVEWSGASTLDDLTQLGVVMLLAPAQFSGAATLDPVTGAGAMDVNEPQGLRGTFTAPMPILTMRASPAVVYGVTASAPRPALVARGGHRAVLQGPMPMLTATATTMQMARAILTSPMPYLEATGRVSGQSAVQATAPRPTLVARGGHQATGTFPAATLTMSATAGGVARATLTAPRATLDARITNDNTAKIVATAPMLRAIPSGRVQVTGPMGTLMASASGVQAVTYESYVLNMNQPLDDNPRNNFEAKVEQATRYTNWPFTQVVRMANSYYGVAADGLYELGGTTDNGAEIQWRIETCKTDFGEPHRKTVASAYVAGQTGALIDYTLRSGDDPDTVYAYTTTKTVEKRNHRQKFGLGRRNRYYSFGLAGTGKAAIDSIELELLSTTRRI